MMKWTGDGGMRGWSVAVIRSHDEVIETIRGKLDALG